MTESPSDWAWFQKEIITDGTHLSLKSSISSTMVACVSSLGWERMLKEKLKRTVSLSPLWYKLYRSGVPITENQPKGKWCWSLLPQQRPLIALLPEAIRVSVTVCNQWRESCGHARLRTKGPRKLVVVLSKETMADSDGRKWILSQPRKVIAPLSRTLISRKMPSSYRRMVDVNEVLHVLI